MTEYRPTLNAEVAGYMAAVAKALVAVSEFKSDHGTYYVSEVKFGYDGDDTGYRVIPNEFGGFDLDAVTPDPAS
ncbi:hypothetical protein CFH99_07890 [Nocardioides aromaticivorans]|uniref:Uncharacterized protein n=1 Tax=Nocardioides aromaticivorans TaxID=200618 RepID=A0ABX7PIC8_9ACTN|nr:hypothetical protein [Nocardioides aromaticivorans]QSR25542.1 hypothetical protein CFH99_07890 [Nocardioides aromaticivorans]